MAGNLLRGMSDTVTLLGRNMLRYRRMPDVFVFLVIQPLIVLLVFRYILGGAIRVPGIDYVDYLMPGIFGLAVINGSSTTGIGLAEDLVSGTVDHLRSLPIARSALLAARALTDVVRNLIVVPLVALLGVAVGFNMTGTGAEVLLAYFLLLGLGLAFAWISINLALWTGAVEATQALGFLLAMVASFASSGFVPVATMPPWIRGVVTLNPVTHVDNAVRTLTTGYGGDVVHELAIALLWIVAIIVTAMPLALMRYARAPRFAARSGRISARAG